MSLGPSDYFDLASAVGTIAATVVALWLGLSARRNSEDEDLKRARLCAALISVRLTATHSAIRSVAISSLFKDMTVSEERAAIKALQHIRDVVLGGLFVPSHQELIELTPLNNNCAHRIARAFDYIEKVRSEAMRVNERGLFSEQFDSNERERLLQSWGGTLFTASELLEVALRECNKASELGAPIPSGEELYDNP